MQEIVEIQNIINKIIDIIKPNKIMLFGSRARGNFNQESDYDILILKEGIINKRNLAFELYRLISDEPFAIDFLVDTPDNFNEQISNPHKIYNSIFKEGKILYER